MEFMDSKSKWGYLWECYTISWKSYIIHTYCQIILVQIY